MFLGWGQVPAFLISPSNMLQRLNSKQVQPRCQRIPSSTQPPLLGWRIYLRHSTFKQQGSDNLHPSSFVGCWFHAGETNQEDQKLPPSPCALLLKHGCHWEGSTSLAILPSLEPWLRDSGQEERQAVTQRTPRFLSKEMTTERGEVQA